MIKRFSMLAIAGMMVLPTMALAGGGAGNADLEQKIEELSRQLEELRAQMAEQKEVVADYGDKVDDMDERSDAWDLAARFQFNGDFRARGDYYDADYVLSDRYNDTIMTNRLRLNMRVKATEDLTFKGRLAMYKVWGMQDVPTGLAGGYPIYDGNTTRTPNDSALYVDRAYLNWTNIGGMPVWFSIGRRPTSDGPPAQLRMGTDERMATPVAYMDYPFDGISLGYAYDWGIDALGSGRIRFCYGRGFENGLQEDTGAPLDDTDFAGISWDVFQQGPRFMNIQAFGAFNLFDYPGTPSKNVGNMFHTSAVYMDKIDDLSFFIAGGWSRSDPDSSGMFNAGAPNTDSEDGYSVYAGIRYDMDNIGLKLGAEYNYGSQYWVSFSPGHDDLYQSKLATRGNVYELYMIYDLPTGEAISKYAKTFVRLGWQYYDYQYTGSGDYTMYPFDIDDPNLPAALTGMGAGMDAVESAHQVYLTFEAYF
ncbi:DUF3373 domain-containing protein [Desulfobulbus rhabdoformis]|uniref:DUF3373 family protein n=1 Tax=Desulfobulbus rhabdoformis TaxID=34032 RepID=UPI0019669ED1|nr:DUF3373 family protein [Desulfobulbus rhabdoformis]MBM9614347.1 DUF3373 domain-containing protein [Desulfobulbus rhabdoformis]